MRKNTIFGMLALFLFLASCKGSDTVEVGQKTSMSVNEVFNAGTVIKGEKIDAVFTVENTGDYPLVISGAQPSCGCTVADFPQDPILPGESGKISAHVNTENQAAGALNKSVTITANTEPSNKEVVIKAMVKNK